MSNTVPGAGARAPKIRKKYDFSHEIPQEFSHLPPLGAIFLSAPPLTRNPGSAPVYGRILINMNN
jgi:hypothetical protein